MKKWFTIFIVSFSLLFFSATISQAGIRGDLPPYPLWDCPTYWWEPGDTWWHQPFARCANCDGSEPLPAWWIGGDLDGWTANSNSFEHGISNEFNYFTGGTAYNYGNYDFFMDNPNRDGTVPWEFHKFEVAGWMEVWRKLSDGWGQPPITLEPVIIRRYAYWITSTSFPPTSIVKYQNIAVPFDNVTFIELPGEPDDGIGTDTNRLFTQCHYFYGDVYFPDVQTLPQPAPPGTVVSSDSWDAAWGVYNKVILVENSAPWWSYIYVRWFWQWKEVPLFGNTTLQNRPIGLPKLIGLE